MDLKGINWVGHMYQKCETMLLEVEDDMYQDVVNYVENQVQTVGDSVKKFYSDVIQDLLPPSAEDLLTPQDSNLPVEKYAETCAYKKPKAGTMEVQVIADAETVMQNPKAIDVEAENRASFYHGLSSVNSSSVSMSTDSLSGSCSKLYSAEEGSRQASGIYPYLHESHGSACDEMAISGSGCDGIEYAVKYESDASIDGPSSDNKVTEARLSSCGSLPAELNAADMSSSHDMVPMVRSATNWDTQSSDVTNKRVISSNSGEEDDSGEDEINSKDVIELDMMKTFHQGDHLKLEESCVVVNGDELHCVPLSKGKAKSRLYKKKIRDALSLRMKSARKEEYKQLAVLYADEAAGSNHQPLESLRPDHMTNNKRSSSTHDMGESEWEFL